jgi:non-ribosomal peptide synthase protein (TIGR01720 family)
MLQAVWWPEGARLLLVADHLAVDGVSWRIVGAGLAEAWQAVRAGERPRQAPTGTSFRTWSRLLAEEARSPERLRELPWWTGVLEGARPLLDHTPDPAGPVQESTLVLPHEITAPLLTTVPAAYHAAVPDVLLTALALAVAARREERGDLTGRSLLVGVESHGRAEEIAEGVDLSATVGWFTGYHPVAVDPGPLDLHEALAGGPAAGTALKRVKEQLRAVPGQGLGYGLLRHLNPDTAPALEKLPQPQVTFNYLGRFTASADASGEPWELAPEAPMLRVRPDRAAAALELDAVAVEDTTGVRLHVSAAWPAALLTTAEADGLLAAWRRALTGLVRHTRTAPGGGLTPSDLPLVEVTQEDLDDFAHAFDDYGIHPGEHDDF